MPSCSMGTSITFSETSAAVVAARDVGNEVWQACSCSGSWDCCWLRLFVACCRDAERIGVPVGSVFWGVSIIDTFTTGRVCSKQHDFAACSFEIGIFRDV